jgi:Flp pilus assembly protein TadD
MSKPMGVTLPVILLFVDFWPLQRWPVGSIGWRTAASDDHPGTGNRESGIPVRRLVLEKVPLFVLAALSSVVTYVAQSRGGAVKAMGGFPLDSRIANAVLSYWAYLGKALWPTRLSAFYPYGSPTLTDGGVIVGALAMAAFTAAAWRWRRRTPYLLMGWAWYLIGLLPVIGLLQMGEQAMADRYTYLPFVGPFVALSWGAADLARLWPPARRLLLGAACAVTVALAGVAWRQTAHWRTTETLFAQALRATGGNWFAHNNYGAALIAEGRTEEAAAHFREAIRIRPRYPQGHFNLGVALQKLGQTGEARESYRAALAIRPRYWEAHFRLGGLYEAIGGLGEAEAEYSAAVEADPGEMLSRYRLGALLARRDQFAEAERHLREVVREMPRLAEARNTLGVALAGMGRTSEAVVQFEEALRLQPGYGEARFNLDAVRGEMPARAAASRGTGDR